MSVEIEQEIAANREIMEHATMAFVGLEYLEGVVDDDQVLRDEIDFEPDWGNEHDGLFAVRSSLAWIIARKAAHVCRLGNGLPTPTKGT